MKFVNSQYLIYIIVTIILIVALMMRQHHKYFQWIKTYWFLDRTWANRISNLLYYLSLALFLLSLLDLRGPETKIKGALPDQRTIIVLDASLSMLCEDVRPNRFIKSIQLARHFAKNSAGHQISIVIFSDTQKRLLPFTDDIDLIDSRLAALENTNTIGGGSNISQAISEVAGYFETDSESEAKDTSGNIIVFTDGEEGEGGLAANLPANVNLAVIGVGTAKGGNIPLRWEDGSFKGYKTHKNETVITRLDEKFIKNLGKKIKNYNYWIVNSYSLPTEEILNFFRGTYNKSHNNGDMRIRPVYSHLILIPAIVLYCLSILFGRLNTFKMNQLVVLFLLFSGFFGSNCFAEEAEKGQRPAYSKDLTGDLEKFRDGKSTHKEILKTAEKLLREKDEKKASEIYSEYLKNSDDEEARFNYVTSLLKQGKLKEAKQMARELLNNSKNEELKNKMRENLLMSVEKKQKNKEEQKDKNKDQNQKNDQQDNKENKNQSKDNRNGNDDKKNNDNKKNESQSSDGKNNDKQNKQDQKNNKGMNDKQPENKQKSESSKKNDSNDLDKNKEENKKKDEGKKNEENKKNGNESDDKEEKENQGPKSLEEKEKMIEQKRRMTKLPGMVKQIMNDDRELQKKLMDTSTKEKGELKPSQDW